MIGLFTYSVEGYESLIMACADDRGTRWPGDPIHDPPENFPLIRTVDFNDDDDV